MKEIEYVKLSELKLSKSNPRKITKNEFRKLCDNITADPKFLEYRPILVYVEDDEKIVYAGNQRVRAAKHIGFSEIACIIDNKSDLTDEIIRRRTIIDNRHAGEFDYDELANSWDLNELLVLGFDPQEFDLTLEEKPKKEKKPALCSNCGAEI